MQTVMPLKKCGTTKERASAISTVNC